LTNAVGRGSGVETDRSGINYLEANSGLRAAQKVNVNKAGLKARKTACNLNGTTWLGAAVRQAAQRDWR